MNYVYANINPTTYKTLKKNKKKIQNDLILDFLENALYKFKKEGYECYLYAKEASDFKGVNRVAKKMTEAVFEMHEMVVDILNLPHKKNRKI